MASFLLSSLFSDAMFKIVNSTTGFTVVPNLAIIKVGFRYSSNNLRHMLEDGSSVVDARIILPCAIIVDAMCPDIDTATQLLAVLNDRQNLYEITSRGLLLRNMMAQSTTQSQTPEVLTAAPFRISFKQQLVQNVAPVVCEQAGDSSLLDRGIQLVANATQNVTTLFNNVRNSITNTLGV